MFSFLSGAAPDEENETNLIIEFEKLGEISAHLHEHVLKWRQSSQLCRPVWDFDTMLGHTPRWGRWQDGFGMTPERIVLFTRLAGVIQKRLMQFGKDRDRFGLIHADLRLANLLVDKSDVKVIDFDDCGFGWFLYDLGAALSFIEHKAYVPDLIAAWLNGYRSIRLLSQEAENEIPTFVMLRRLLLVAWIGSHADTETAQALGGGYTDDTVVLTDRYLTNFA
jgi:Ser/Thr protein kinase RdoA (MazF antagonist)